MGPNSPLIFTEEKTEEQMGLNNQPKVPLLGTADPGWNGVTRVREEFWGRRPFPKREAICGA